MRIGVDSSVIVAAVHLNHPRHVAAADWLVSALAGHELTVCHHSVLEAYAVLTSLPGSLRVTPPEARELLSATVRANMSVADFMPESIWTTVDFLVPGTVCGGRSYDAFVAFVLRSAGAQAVATFNRRHFSGLAEGLEVIDPSAPEFAAGT